MRASRGSHSQVEGEVVMTVGCQPEAAWEPAPLDAWVAFYRELEGQRRVAAPQTPRIQVGRPAIHGRLASSI